MTARRDEAGFTLAEVLVSLAVIGLCAVLFTAVIGRIGFAARHGDAADAERARIADAQRLLADRIARMQPLLDPRSSATVEMTGQGDRLDFTADATGPGTPDAPRRYRIARDPAGDLALYQLSTLDAVADPGAADSSRWARQVLLDGAAGLEIGYFGPDPVTGQPAWQREWIHRPGLPQLVRIAVSFPDEDRRVWPELVVHPRAGTGDTCQRVARLGTCRGES